MKTILKAMVAALSVFAAVPVAAQSSLDLTVDGVGISVGDSRRVTGLRLNFRDRYLEKVDGINITLWSPYDDPRGVVRGLALGLPATGAERIDGIAAGIVGVGAAESIRGLAIGGIGLGVGEDLQGIAIGGIGFGAGRDIQGLAIGGIGGGIGGDLRGIGIGGIGFGVGGNAKGMLLSGIGAGVGGNMQGLSIAGIGIGAGGDVKGITVTGIGLGAGGDVTGIQLAGIGIGAGGTLKWVSIAGAGIGAPRIQGLAVASAVGAEQVRGVVIAPIYFKISRGGHMRGVNLSAYNDVRGTQQGLAIAIFNYARTLDGVQIGLLNYAGNKSRGTRLLPIANFARAK
jgi:hypothetical protein